MVDRRTWAEEIAQAALNRAISQDGAKTANRVALAGPSNSVLQVLQKKIRHEGRRGVVFVKSLSYLLSSLDSETIETALLRLQEWGRAYPIEYRDSTGALTVGWRGTHAGKASDHCMRITLDAIRAAGPQGVTGLDLSLSIPDRWDLAVERLACSGMVTVQYDDTTDDACYTYIATLIETPVDEFKDTA